MTPAQLVKAEEFKVAMELYNKPGDHAKVNYVELRDMEEALIASGVTYDELDEVIG